MSIIHEALKKMQMNLNNNENQKESQPPMSSDQPSQPDQTNNSQPPNNPGQPQSEYNPEKDMNDIYNKLHQKPGQVPPGTPIPKQKKSSTTSDLQNSPAKNFITIAICLMVIIGASWFIYQYYALDMEKKGVDLKKAFTIKPKKLNFSFGSKNSSSRPMAKSAEDYLPDEIELNGITTMGSTRVALINNQIYRVGETFKEYKIMNISMEQVELKDKAGNIYSLKIKNF